MLFNRPDNPQNCPFPSNVWLLGSTRVYVLIGISIGSAVFACLTNVTNKHTKCIRCGLIIISAQSNLAKSRIANLSPFVDAIYNICLNNIGITHCSSDSHESARKRHLDRFSRFCSDHERYQQTDT